MREILIKGGSVALVDDEDFEKVAARTWYLGRNGYAHRRMYGVTHYMHHMVVGKPPAGMVTDHANRNRLDNRRCNLRFVTPHENSMNKDWEALRAKHGPLKTFSVSCGMDERMFETLDRIARLEYRTLSNLVHWACRKYIETYYPEPSPTALNKDAIRPASSKREG